MTAELLTALRLAIQLAQTIGLTPPDLAAMIAKAHAEGREVDATDIAAARNAALDSGARADAAIKRAEDALGDE